MRGDPEIRGRALNVFKESHEAEIHVEILMAVKEGARGCRRQNRHQLG